MSIETQKEKNYLFTKNLTDYKSESKCPLLSYFRGKTFQIKQDNGKDLYISKKRFFTAYHESSGIDEKKISDAFNKVFKSTNSWSSFFSPALFSCKKPIYLREETFKKQLKVEIASNEILEVIWPDSSTVSSNTKEALITTLNNWVSQKNQKTLPDGFTTEQLLEKGFLIDWRTNLNILNNNKQTEESTHLTTKINSLNLQGKTPLGIHTILDKFSPPLKIKTEEELAEEALDTKNEQARKALAELQKEFKTLTK